MSGGHFDYQQYKLGYIADEIEQLILTNDSEELNQWGDQIGRHYNAETIVQFQFALGLVRRAQIYVQRIDWLVSGDDSEESFHKRLHEELRDERKG